MKNDKTWIIVVGIVLVIVLFVNINNNSFHSLQIHYYKNGTEVFPNKLFSVVTPPGGTYDAISFSISGKSSGSSFSNIKIISATPTAFYNSLPTSTQSLNPNQNKVLFSSGIIPVNQFESYSQPVRFFVNISATDDYNGQTVYSSSYVDLKIEPTTTTCTDSDGGLNYEISGRALIDGIGTYDCCLNQQGYGPCVDNIVTPYLGEAYCSNGVPSINYITCDKGCLNGACVDSSPQEDCDVSYEFPPALPKTYTGLIKNEGLTNSILTGKYILTAKIGDIIVGSSVYNCTYPYNNCRYTIDISPLCEFGSACICNNVKFYIGDIELSQTGNYLGSVDGGVTKTLDLSVSSWQLDCEPYSAISVSAPYYGAYDYFLESSNQYISQIFYNQGNNLYLDHVCISATRTGSIGIVNVSIKNVDSNGYPTGGELLNTQVNLDYFGVYTPVTSCEGIYFDNELLLENNKKYALIINVPTANVNNNLRLLTKSQPTSSLGTLYSDDYGVSWEKNTNTDTGFAIKTSYCG